MAVQPPWVVHDQPPIELGGEIHVRWEHPHDLTSHAQLQHIGEKPLHVNPDCHSNGEAQQYGRNTAEDDISLPRYTTVRVTDNGSQDGGASSATPSAPAQQKYLRRTQVGRDIAAARAAARGTQHDNHFRPTATAGAAATLPQLEVATTVGATAVAVSTATAMTTGQDGGLQRETGNGGSTPGCGQTGGQDGNLPSPHSQREEPSAQYPDFYYELSPCQRKNWRRRNRRK
jgi:hypothetical protein